MKARFDEEGASKDGRHLDLPHGSLPDTHLLSNGRYSVMLTAAGSGYSRWRDIALTRWREDVTCDNWGSYIFLRDVRSGRIWSAGYQPSGRESDHYDVICSESLAAIVRQDGEITTRTEIAVSPDDDAEVRRVSITNHGSETCEIELTSYAELVLAAPGEDNIHPTFSKMFVETEFMTEEGILLATRRLRTPSEAAVWAAHLTVVEGQILGDLQFETDRSHFLSSGCTVRDPIAIITDRALTNTAGTVLDPVFSLRRRVLVPPQTTVRVAFWTLTASSRSSVLDLAHKYNEQAAFDRLIPLAQTQAQNVLDRIGIRAFEADLFQRLAGSILYSNPALRPPSAVLGNNMGAQSMLWTQGISGDVPIVVVRIDKNGDLEVVRQLLLAHEYWGAKQLAVDLVILNEQASPAADLQTALEGLLQKNKSPQKSEKPVRVDVFILRADAISPEIRNGLETVARVVFCCGRGNLAEQIGKRIDSQLSGLALKKDLPLNKPPQNLLPLPSLEFFNGLGGFTERGREYVTVLNDTRLTPSPWINVIANPSFGFQVSAAGSGYTWAINSQQNHITPWSNDPVADTPGEAFYIRDQESGEIWTTTALPIREEDTTYIVRHGQGYSRFEHMSHGISLDLLQYVPVGDPIKISRLKITNYSGRTRRLSVTAYVEWVLGPSRTATAPYVMTEIDPETGAMLAQNLWNDDFGRPVAFAALGGRQDSWTGDRTEFLGRNGTLAKPAALAGAVPLSNKTGADLDPCGALQNTLELKENSTVEIVFFLGETATRAESLALLGKYRSADLDGVLDAVTHQWDGMLETVQVTTPDRAMDILLNRWLPYQVLACRVWARAAFYQASGAYGFRDQLQDVMALAVLNPAVTRAHLLRAAARQFTEGDVQHWWLPETGKGLRSRISDDRLWLPYAVAHYVEVTGDLGVLDENISFLEGPALREGETDAFFLPGISDRRGTLFEHCALAIDSSLTSGTHGLPLIGTGDWNDGMNRVGEKGKGESIWLGWFLHTVLTSFAPLTEARDELARVKAWQLHSAALKDSLEREGWDGGWYRRAYYDDGTPLGSASNEECRIDAIAQSWSVISQAAEPTRAAKAMAALEENLVRHDDALILLLTPPFDRTKPDPGYIKAYPPGIRENGGQYTHGAVWSVIAFAMLGDGDKAGNLFSMLNPINHAKTPEAVDRYKVEPYVICADVYSTPPHVGRGGWTWYTGSAGWMYRAGLEWILGFRLQGTTLRLDPCIPKTWPGFGIRFRYRSARYDIQVENPRAVCRGIATATLDGKAIDPASIPMTDDGTNHQVKIVLG